MYIQIMDISNTINATNIYIIFLNRENTNVCIRKKTCVFII